MLLKGHHDTHKLSIEMHTKIGSGLRHVRWAPRVPLRDRGVRRGRAVSNTPKINRPLFQNVFILNITVYNK